MIDMYEIPFTGNWLFFQSQCLSRFWNGEGFFLHVGFLFAILGAEGCIFFEIYPENQIFKGI